MSISKLPLPPLPKPWRRWITTGAIAVALLVAAFLAGRFSKPAEVREVVKVETKTVTEWKDRVVYVKDQKKKATTTTTKKPTGEVVIVKVEETDTDTHATTASDGALHSFEVRESEKVTTSAKPGWRAGVNASWSSLFPRPDAYGVEVDRRLFGTVWLGVRASTDKTAGIAVGLEW